MEARLAPIQWVNEKLARRIRMIRLTRPSMEGVPAYSLADWDVALRNPGDASSRPTVTMANFQQSVALTSHDWLVTLNRDVLETMQRIRGFDALIDEKAGKLSPGLLQFRNEVSSAAQLVETMLGGTRGNMPKPSDGPELAPEAGSMLALPNALESQQAELEQSSTAEYVGRIRTRAEAYRLLEEIADFLYHTDPHSPTPYLIRRAVSWGDKHFDELLPELVRDNGELSDIIKLLRIEMPAKGPK